MTDDATRQASTWPLQDAQAVLVQRTVLAALWLGAAAAAIAAVLHWLDPLSDPVHRVVPGVLGAGLVILALRQARRPDALSSTLWLSWWLSIAALAVPTWWFLARSLRSGELLVELLPPVGAALPPVLVGMALFAKPRVALGATLIAWVAIALPVLAYLGAHLPQLWTPRGLDLAISLGPGALFVPLLVPLLRGIERRFHALRREGERLQALAERDVLLGLYNRRAGERFLATLLAHARDDAALVLFDIDHFKRINDTYGHPAGDAVLVEVGKRGSAQLGPSDIFARWGGEEFLVVLPGVGAAEATSIAERLRFAIAATPIEKVGTVTASFGVTAVRVGDTLAEVVQRADEALYQAKAGGRNRVVNA